MKKITLVAALLAAGTIAMAEDTVTYDFSSTKSSDVVHYDNGSYGNSDNVVKYDMRDEENTLQNTSKTESK